MKKISKILYWLSGEKDFSWLQEKKFWLFFLVQAVLWFLYSMFPFAITIYKSVNVSEIVVISLILSVSVILFQIFTAAILPKTSFFILAAYILVNCLTSWSFLIAGIWWALRKFKPTKKLKKIIVGIIAFLIFGLITFILSIPTTAIHLLYLGLGGHF